MAAPGSTCRRLLYTAAGQRAWLHLATPGYWADQAVGEVARRHFYSPDAGTRFLEGGLALLGAAMAGA